MKPLLIHFSKDESGATAIEYGLIATLISVAIIAGTAELGSALCNLFAKLATTIVRQATG